MVVRAYRRQAIIFWSYINIIVKKLKFKRECKGRTYNTAEIILLCHKVLCLFCTVIFTSELIAKRHSLSCHSFWKILSQRK